MVLSSPAYGVEWNRQFYGVNPMPIGSEGIVSQALPQAFADQLPAPPRMGKYREAYGISLINNNYGVADEGSYFVTTNPTPGTPINYAIQTTFSDTVAAFTFRNGAGAGGKRIYLDYIRMLMGATAPASATSMHYALKVDNIIRGSAGTVPVPQNPNMAADNASIADIRYTPTVAAVGASARLVDRGVVRSVIPVANDEYIFSFGSVEKAASISDIAGTTAKRIVIPCPPVILGPGANHTALLHIWLPANAATAGQFEFGTGHWER